MSYGLSDSQRAEVQEQQSERMQNRARVHQLNEQYDKERRHRFTKGFVSGVVMTGQSYGMVQEDMTKSMDQLKESLEKVRESDQVESGRRLPDTSKIEQNAQRQLDASMEAGE